VEPNDEVVITAIAPYSDSQLLNRRYRVVTPVASTYSTARRFQIEEAVS
jgi:hypothetical protein